MTDARWAVLLAATLGVAFAVGTAVVMWAGEPAPERSLEHLSLPLVWATPAGLAVLSLRDRCALLVPAGVLGVVLAFTSFSVTPLLLIPSGLCFYARTRSHARPATVARLGFVVLVPLVLAGGAFWVLLASDSTTANVSGQASLSSVAFVTAALVAAWALSAPKALAHRRSRALR
ncbi:hypothetical protein BH18ACT1_BH18ACT1_10490 [soil metagenome]